MSIQIIKGDKTVKKMKVDGGNVRQIAREALATIKSDFAEIYDKEGILRHVVYIND